jgi:hypothetical protein
MPPFSENLGPSGWSVVARCSMHGKLQSSRSLCMTDPHLHAIAVSKVSPLGASTMRLLVIAVAILLFVSPSSAKCVKLKDRLTPI